MSQPRLGPLGTPRRATTLSAAEEAADNLRNIFSPSAQQAAPAGGFNASALAAQQAAAQQHQQATKQPNTAATPGATGNLGNLGNPTFPGKSSTHFVQAVKPAYALEPLTLEELPAGFAADFPELSEQQLGWVSLALKAFWAAGESSEDFQALAAKLWVTSRADTAQAVAAVVRGLFGPGFALRDPEPSNIVIQSLVAIDAELKRLNRFLQAATAELPALPLSKGWPGLFEFAQVALPLLRRFRDLEDAESQAFAARGLGDTPWRVVTFPGGPRQLVDNADEMLELVLHPEGWLSKFKPEDLRSPLIWAVNPDFQHFDFPCTFQCFQGGGTPSDFDVLKLLRAGFIAQALARNFVSPTVGVFLGWGRWPFLAVRLDQDALDTRNFVVDIASSFVPLAAAIDPTIAFVGYKDAATELEARKGQALLVVPAPGAVSTFPAVPLRVSEIPRLVAMAAPNLPEELTLKEQRRLEELAKHAGHATETPTPDFEQLVATLASSVDANSFR